MDELFLRRAIELALTGSAQREGGPFGAVVVQDGTIIGEGWNRVVACNDPSAHAEINAIRAACARRGSFHLSGCVLYASSEPCPMCLSAAYWARIARIVFANTRAEAAAIGFCDDELYGELRLPHAQRSVPTTHLPLAGADEPLIQWRNRPDRVVY